ncbi:MAG: LuxR family transcriptional regulator [Nocardioides sp.]
MKLTDWGPDQRALFETQCLELFEEIVSAGSIRAADPRIAPGGVERDAFDLLSALGLLRLDPTAAAWLPEDPGAIQAQVVAPMSNEGSRLLEESAGWAKAFTSMSQSFRQSGGAQARGPFVHLHGDAIDPYLRALIDDAQEELLTAQPQTGRDPAKLAPAAERDIAAIERGISMRTLYQHSARRSTVTRGYVAAVSARGAEVRTLDEFFNRMIVVDRKVVVIPGNDGLMSAMVVREPALVDYLVDVFERSWERGRPFSSQETSDAEGIASEQRAMTVRMLIEGHADPVSAKRLGVSPRTYAGYIADLKDELEVSTRFQMGYALGRRSDGDILD